MFTLAATAITITLGWWLVPTIITFLLICVLIYVVVHDQDAYTAGMASVFFFLFAFGVSVFSWLIWALCNMNIDG